MCIRDSLTAVDLVDNRVHHVVGVLQAGEVLGGADPTLEPAVVLTLPPPQSFERVLVLGVRLPAPGALGKQEGVSGI